MYKGRLYKTIPIMKCERLSGFLGQVRFVWTRPFTIEEQDIPLHKTLRFSNSDCEAEIGQLRYPVWKCASKSIGAFKLLIL